MEIKSDKMECLPADYYTALVVTSEKLHRRQAKLAREAAHQRPKSGIEGIIRANRYLLEVVEAERARVHALLAHALPRFEWWPYERNSSIGTPQ